ncbi:hypothetical protein HPB51_009199 [Rhipicephalus microplus]|uniref:Uncharacterized protein n=1 Tax=Rhipicephalus microplus TaxID=6941 RepID=A0A9J6F0B6_RHIMP|nr:hypothetical protein HPB51_009199 [Rhipicephalus microplus]
MREALPGAQQHDRPGAISLRADEGVSRRTTTVAYYTPLLWASARPRTTGAHPRPATAACEESGRSLPVTARGPAQVRLGPNYRRVCCPACADGQINGRRPGRS